MMKEICFYYQTKFHSSDCTYKSNKTWRYSIKKLKRADNKFERLSHDPL